MKKILLIVLVTLISCAKEGSKKQTTVKKDELSEQELQLAAERAADSAIALIDFEARSQVEGRNPKIDEAKLIIDSATEWMNKAIRKEVSKDAANNRIDPLMKDFEKINNSLSSWEQEHLQEYRIQKAQQSIDLQIQYSK